MLTSLPEHWLSVKMEHPGRSHELEVGSERVVAASGFRTELTRCGAGHRLGRGVRGGGRRGQRVGVKAPGVVVGVVVDGLPAASCVLIVGDTWACVSQEKPQELRTPKQTSSTKDHILLRFELAYAIAF